MSLNKVATFLVTITKFIKRLQVKKFYSSLSYIHNTGSEPLKPLTIGKLLDQIATKYGDREAVVSKHQERIINFREVLEEADKLAAGLKNIGHKPGDRIGIWAPNLIEWYISFMACARAGMTSVTVNPAFQANEIKYCINKVGIKSLICTHEFKTQNNHEILKEVIPGLDQKNTKNLTCEQVPSLKNIITISQQNLPGTLNFEDILKTASDNEIKSVKKHQDFIKMDDPSNIQFTSGTTGNPKAVLISHFQLVNNGYCSGIRNELHIKQRRICVQVPLFHAYGTVVSIMSGLAHTATLVLPSPSFNPVKSCEAIKTENCSIIYGTPTMYVDLVKVQKQRQEEISPEIAVTGGALCTPQLFNDMLEVLKVKKVKSVYGLTEATGVVFQSQHDDNEIKTTSTVGYISAHTEAKVVDKDGKIVPRGTPGELFLRGYFIMSGYFGDPDKTKDTIGGDKWLRTGDQFVLEEDGYGKVVGRIKELIIRGGENIFPGEIEGFLNTHPDIIETHVIGLPHERLGEEVCACIRIKEGTTLTLDEIRAFCTGNIASFKIPSTVKIMEAFPKTESGKIQKFKLIENILKANISG